VTATVATRYRPRSRSPKHASAPRRFCTRPAPAPLSQDHPHTLGEHAAVTDWHVGWSRFLNVDPEVSVTGQPYEYASDDPINLTDPSGLNDCGPFSFVCDVGHVAAGGAKAVGNGAGAALNAAGQGLSDALYQLVPGNPAYINACVGWSDIVAGDLCVQVTHSGHVYVAPDWE
jgi:hypothetical protein